MNIIRSLYRWGTLHLLTGVFIAAFFWEENLDIKPGDHILLATGILFGFGFVLNRWINHHETNFLVSEFDDAQIDQKKGQHHRANNIHVEKTQ